MDELKVTVDNELSGELIKENNEFIFRYETDKKDSFISLIMPVRKKDYLHNNIHPIFEMHLPEGYLLSIIKKHFSKLLKTDDFGLLKVMSNSIKARVQYLSNQALTDDTLSLNDLLHPKKENLFDELVSKFALKSALSGVQPKVLATVKDKATLRCDDYIVKSWGDDYKELALNEYYCMKIVKRSGVDTAEFYISDDEKLFIMKRFDKKDDGTYIGFEDMCVLMAKQRDDKYEGTYEQVAKVAKTFVSPKYKKSSLINFFKMIVINNMVQNGDAHLKNFGLIYEDIDNIKLAPAYDVVSTTVYIKNDIPALHLMGSKKWWSKKHLLNFGRSVCDLTPKEAEDAYTTCQNSLIEVKSEIEKRLKIEKNQDKIELLQKLYRVFLLRFLR